MHEIKLGDYLNSLYSRNNTETNDGFRNIFHLYHDLFNKSKISHLTQCVLRFIFLIINDLFIITLPYKLSLFNAFELTDKITFGNVLTVLLTKKVAYFAILLSLFILIIEVVIFAKYDADKQLTDKTATFLHVLMYITPLCSLLLGLVLGCFLLCDSGDLSFFDKNVYGILVSIMFLFICVSYYIFLLIGQYSLIINTGKFASFEQPYATIDLVYFYCMGISFPCRSSNSSIYNYYTMIFTIASVFWSIHKLISRRRCCYVSSLANFVDFKVIVDTFVYSILSFFCILNEQAFSSYTIFSVIIYQIIVLIVVYIVFYIFKSGNVIYENGEIDVQKCKYPSDATALLRICVSYGFKETVIKKLIKWILDYKFEPQVIPDIVRYSLIMGIPLNDFNIPYFPASLTSIISLKFLAFQVRQYNKCLYDDNNPIVLSVIEKINHEIKYIQKISDDFWTERDLEELTIESLGQKIDKTTTFIQSAVLTFPNSNRIKELWEHYVTNIICSPSKKIINAHVNFETIKFPGKTVYGLVNQSTPDEVNNRKQKTFESPTESFIQSYSNKVSKYFLVFAKIVLIVIILYIITSYILFILGTKNVFNVYSKFFYKAIVSLSFPIKLVNYSDEVIFNQTVIDFSDLNISEQQIQMLQSDLIIYNDVYSNAFEYIQEYISTKFQIKNEFCSYIPISSIANINIYKEWDVENKFCFITWADLYSECVVNNIIDDIKNFDYDNKFFIKTQNYIIISYLIIFSFIFIIFIIHQYYRFNNLIKCIKNIVSIKNKVIHHGNYKIVFGPLNVFIYFILTTVFVISLELFYKRGARDLYNNNFLFINRFVDFINICRWTLISYSYMGAKKSGNYQTNYINNILKNYSKLILESSSNFSINDISSKMLNYDGLGNWYNETYFGFSDFSNYLNKFIEFPNDEFICSVIRYIIGSKLGKVVSKSIPSMIKFTQFFKIFIQSSFWYYSFTLLLFVGILWLIVRLINMYQRNTINGIKTLIKRTHAQFPQQCVFILVNIFNSTKNYINDIPIPFVIRNSDGIIVSANQIISSYIGSTIEQIVGQPYDEYFDDNGPKNIDESMCFTSEVTNFKDEFELVLFHNKTKLKEEQSRIENIINEMTPVIPKVETIQEMIYIEGRINADVLNIEYIFSTFSELRIEFPEIKCIACGATFFYGYSSKGNEEEVMRFLNMFCELFINNCILAATFGKGCLLSLSGKGPLVVMIGKLSERAHNLTTNYGLWNRIYVDWTILEKTSIADDISFINEEKEYEIVSVSPLSKNNFVS